MSHISQQTVAKAPLSSSELLRLCKLYEGKLGYNSTCELSESQVESISNLTPADFSIRQGPFILHSNGTVSMLSWMMNNQECRERFSRYVMEDPWKWKDTVGEIRNQMFHLLCWSYVATDLVSGLMKRVLGHQFVPLSAWHICAYCKPDMLFPKVGIDGKLNEDHHCYGLTTENGIIHIQFLGGNEEISVKFDCKDHHPPLTHPLIEIGRVKPRTIKTLDEALRELDRQPVGADLLLYTAAFEFRERTIYYGPMHPHSQFLAYHSVIMMGITEMNGELVVICKFSNGELVADWGYVYVSLAALYIPVGVSERGREFVRGSSTPLHLLTNFVVPELIINDDKKDDDKRDDDEKHDDEKEDDKEKDEKEEDNPKTKRPRLSKPTTGTYGSSSFSKRTGTHQRSRSLHPEEEEEDSIESGPKDGIKVSYSVGDAEELNLKEESWVSIPNQILKTLQTIREITGKQHSDEDIYAVYIECFNDPNETAQKLLSLDTFHEVKNKRDKKKENVIQVTQGSSRNGGRNFPNQGYGRNHVAGGFRPSRPVSNRERNFVGPRANRVSGPNGVGNGKAQVDVAVSVEKGLVEEHPPAKASFASVISAEPKAAAKAIVDPVAKALEPVVNNEPNKLQPFTFGRQDTWEQVTENGNASNEVKDQSVVLKADVGEGSNVTFPFHIQAAKKLQNGLTFGSFASDDESFEPSHETGDDEEEDSSPATNGIPEVVSAREGALSFSDGKDQGDSHSTSENDQIVQPVEQALTNTEAHQIVYGHGAPLSMFGLVPSMPALGQPVNTEGAETQNGTPNASLATYPQQDQLFRQQYQPFFMPPPYIHQYMAPNGIPQQTYYHPGPALAAPSAVSG